MVSGDFNDLDPGDETRRHGDYVGFPHGVPDETAYANRGDADPVEGQPVAYDATNDEIVAFDADGSAPANGAVLGVLFTYPYYGDSSNAGPYVDGDKNATVKTSGTVVADLTTATGGVTEADEGTAVGPNGELLIVNVFDETNNLAEVLVR